VRSNVAFSGLLDKQQYAFHDNFNLKNINIRS